MSKPPGERRLRGYYGVERIDDRVGTVVRVRAYAETAIKDEFLVNASGWLRSMRKVLNWRAHVGEGFYGGIRVDRDSADSSGAATAIFWHRHCEFGILMRVDGSGYDQGAAVSRSGISIECRLLCQSNPAACVERRQVDWNIKAETMAQLARSWVDGYRRLPTGPTAAAINFKQIADASAPDAWI